jgi:hypothetical protein
LFPILIDSIDSSSLVVNGGIDSTKSNDFIVSNNKAQVGQKGRFAVCWGCFFLIRIEIFRRGKSLALSLLCVEAI